MFLRYLEYLLHLRNLPHIRVIDGIGTQHFHFFLRYKTALVAESLLCQILAATIPHCLLVQSALLFLPVSSNLRIFRFVNVRVDGGRSSAGVAHAVWIGVAHVHVYVAALGT